MGTTTIQISNKVKTMLDKIKLIERESYNDVIEILIEDNLELNEKTIRELKERKNEKTISHSEVKRILGL